MALLNLSVAARVALVALAVTIMSTAAEAGSCSATTINRNMVHSIQLGSTPADISQLLGCMPSEIPAPAGELSATRLLVWGIQDANMHKQIAVNFSENYAGRSEALRARYQELPVATRSPSADSNNDTAAAAGLLALVAVSRSLFVGSAVASGCTPATINPGAIPRILPHVSIAAVEATLGCMPTDIYIDNDPTMNPNPTFNTVYRFAVPLLNISIYIITDAQGTLFALYTDMTNPVGTAYNGAIRVEPSLPPDTNWMQSGGFITIPH